VGDEVILTGWGVGEKFWGGYSQYARAKADWLVPMPGRLDARRAMIIGTAGLTAMLCVMTLEEGGIRPKSGPVLVTGAAGGVGSIAVLLLSQLGYKVTAVSGRPETHEYLRALGAVEILGRDAMQAPAKPLETQRWKAAIDVVGGDILARVLAEMDYNGVIAACGLAADYKLNTTVMPFILRNVSLRGVDSVLCPQQRRITAWQRLAAELPQSAYDSLATTIGLEQVAGAAEAIIAGKVRGRILVDPNR
jgi:acrylyl-CoA reductase (NADPH)